MAALLRDRGYEVVVITAMPNYPTGAVFPGYRGRLIHKEILDGIEVIRIWMIPSNSGNLLIRAVSLLSFLFSFLLLAGPRLLFKRSAGVIISSPPLINAWLAALLTKLAGKKLLVNISDIWPLTVTEMGALKDGFLFRLLQRAERFLYKSANAFTGQSQEILDHIQQTVSHSKPDLLYRNLLEEAPGPATAATREKIIYAGNLGHAQGMLELCKNIDFAGPGLSLDIFGDGAERNEIAYYIEQHPDCNITLYPTLPQQQLGERLAAYKAMLIPLKTTIRGAVPSKLFMAVSYGLPVLFCGGGEGAALVKTHQLGLSSDPGDYKTLQEQLHKTARLNMAEWNMLHTHVLHARQTVFFKPAQDAAFATFIAALFDKTNR